METHDCETSRKMATGMVNLQVENGKLRIEGERLRQQTQGDLKLMAEISEARDVVSNQLKGKCAELKRVWALNVDAGKLTHAAIEARDKLKLQIDEMRGRIYKIGLMCDKVDGLRDGYCPEGHGSRDNLTRIKITVEKHITNDEGTTPTSRHYGKLVDDVVNRKANDSSNPRSGDDMPMLNGTRRLDSDFNGSTCLSLSFDAEGWEGVIPVNDNDSISWRGKTITFLAEGTYFISGDLNTGEISVQQLDRGANNSSKPSQCPGCGCSPRELHGEACTVKPLMLGCTKCGVLVLPEPVVCHNCKPN